MDEDAVSELNGKSGQRGLPVPNRHGPFLADVVQGQIEQFEHRIVSQKRASGLFCAGSC